MAVTLVVEDGTSKADANTYVSLAEFSSFCTNRNENAINPDDMPGVLIKAADYIDSFEYMGIKAKKEQALMFPRLIYSPYGYRFSRADSNSSYLIDGYPILPTEIPARIKKAQMVAAVAMASGYDPTATVDRSTLKETVGPITVQYSDPSTSFNGKSEPFTMPLVESLLEPLILGSDIGESSAALLRT